MTNKLSRLLIVMPCYNEAEILPSTADKMEKLLEKLIKDGDVSSDSKICLVDDGSKDGTREIIRNLCRKKKCFSLLGLSRNFGQQEAILAGLFHQDADFYVTLDADLQDDPTVIKKMIAKAKEGADIVYGVRNNRDCDGLFKKFTALAFYKLMRLLGVKSVYNHAEFRLMSRRAVEGVKQFPERNLFLRGIVTLVGFKSAEVFYKRLPRLSGDTKYSWKKMAALAWNAVSSFSVVPLRLVTFAGFMMCLVSLLFLGLMFYWWANGQTVHGWFSLVTIITVFSSAQLLSLGVIGEYVAKIFVEVKKRPLYIIDEDSDEISQNITKK